ncbi:Uncharacterised protein [Streptococcus pneumoniae]|nr:Uncharacterised protein [Streptococcus pneumoniae]
MELSAIYHRPESEYAYLYGGVLSGYKRNGQDNFWYLI